VRPIRDVSPPQRRGGDGRQQTEPLWRYGTPPRRAHRFALSLSAIADICFKRLGVSTVHSLRHTFARGMEDTGAKVSEIQARLGHESLETTGRYLARLSAGENRHLARLSKLFGLVPPADSEATEDARDT
jgi:integrase